MKKKKNLQPKFEFGRPKFDPISTQNRPYTSFTELSYTKKAESSNHGYIALIHANDLPASTTWNTQG